MRTVLIDDEYYALQGLKMKLEEIGGVDVAGMFTSGRQALESIAEINPDIVFVDIELPGISGLELFRKLHDINSNIQIVFTTAFAQYAVSAFELNALDYLIKPVEKNRIAKTIERMEEYMSKANLPNASEKSVVINCFGKLSIVVDGTEITSNMRKKSEELLAFLLCYEGRFVAKERVMDALWPDMNREKAANNLYVAYYNLKKPELGCLSEFVESARGKMRIKAENIECDMFRFKDIYKQCGREIDEGELDVANNAIEIYKGVLFEENYYTWASIEQAELDIMYLDLLDRIINVH